MRIKDKHKWATGGDGLRDAIKTAQGALEDCFTAANETDDLSDADRGAVFALLDEAYVSFDNALTYVEPE